MTTVTLYKNHSGKIGYWEAQNVGATVYITHAKSLDGKATQSQYTAKAKNVGRANETTPEVQAVLEIESRAKKQLDKGYVRTKEEATAPSTNTLGLQKPMLATPLDKVKIDSIDWENAFVQPKLDGHRALHKNGTLYSRAGKEQPLAHILEAINAIGAGHLHLDGELYLHGKSLQEISSLVKRDQPETKDLVYHVYDIVDPEQPWVDRFSEIEEILANADHPSIKIVPSYPVEVIDEVLAHHTLFRNEGYEGTMLRHGVAGYQDGKRSKSLLKVKDFKDAEFDVVGVEAGTPSVTPNGTFEVPVWVCQCQNGETFTVTAQGNREEKHAQWLERESYIGRVLTVKYHYFSKDGKPQLPVALRWYEEI